MNLPQYQTAEQINYHQVGKIEIRPPTDQQKAFWEVLKTIPVKPDPFEAVQRCVELQRRVVELERDLQIVEKGQDKSDILQKIHELSQTLERNTKPTSSSLH